MHLTGRNVLILLLFTLYQVSPPSVAAEFRGRGHHIRRDFGTSFHSPSPLPLPLPLQPTRRKFFIAGQCAAMIVSISFALLAYRFSNQQTAFGRKMANVNEFRHLGPAGVGPALSLEGAAGTFLPLLEIETGSFRRCQRCRDRQRELRRRAFLGEFVLLSEESPFVPRPMAKGAQNEGLDNSLLSLYAAALNAYQLEGRMAVQGPFTPMDFAKRYRAIAEMFFAPGGAGAWVGEVRARVLSKESSHPLILRAVKMIDTIVLAEDAGSEENLTLIPKLLRDSDLFTSTSSPFAPIALAMSLEAQIGVEQLNGEDANYFRLDWIRSYLEMPELHGPYATSIAYETAVAFRTRLLSRRIAAGYLASAKRNQSVKVLLEESSLPPYVSTSISDFVRSSLLTSGAREVNVLKTRAGHAHAE
jgi:hypothetical protein